MQSAARPRSASNGMNSELKYYLRAGKAGDLTDPKERRIYRALEMLPGFLGWGTLIAVVFLSWAKPVWIAVFIIAFDVYWLAKTVYLSFHLRSSFKKMRENQSVNWLEKLAGEKDKDWRKIYHLIIFPMYNESFAVVKQSFDRLVQSNYPLNRFIVVLSQEERARLGPEGESVSETGRLIEREFGDKFFRFLLTVHPQDIAGELAGKGSNETLAAKEAVEKIINPLEIASENVLVSVFDVDTNVPADFFGRLTHAFLTCEKPLRSSFQPIPFFTNNIWEAPALARTIAFSATFWHMMQQERPEKHTTFSSHSMCLKPLIEIGFWQTNIVSEDSRIFWQCFLFYDGDWRTVSLNYPVSMDANVAPTFLGTVKSIYKQQRRWAWGAENIPYALFGFWKDSKTFKKITSRTKLFWAFHKIEGFHSWATNALIIFMLGWLPLILGGTAFNVSVLSYNLPKITRILMAAAMIGLVSSAALSIILLPSRPVQYGRRKFVWMVLQWILLPLIIIVFGSFPALDAQSRLMLGRYMGFWVTPKHRKRDANIRMHTNNTNKTII